MTPMIPLRVASILTLLYCAGHTLGRPWTPAQGSGETAVIAGMRSQQFVLEGFTRTYWDFYTGFGFAISGYLLLLAVVLWQLSGLAKAGSSRLRPLIAAFAAAFLFNAVVVWKFFFTTPAVFATAIALTLGFAFYAARLSSSVPIR